MKELESLGCDVITAGIDVANEAQLSAYLSEFEQMGHPPIRGVFHSAGVVKDTLIGAMERTTFDAVYDIKVLGSYLLHKHLGISPSSISYSFPRLHHW
ncbi:MAG: KR domain-containing protein [Polyangiaceae bacterium]